MRPTASPEEPRFSASRRRGRTRRLPMLLAFLLALCWSGSGGSSAASQTAGADPETPLDSADWSALEATTLELTVAYRRDQGLPPLESHPALVEAARAHSRDMARRQQVDHAGFEARGKGLLERVPYRSLGENVYRTTRGPETASQAAVDAWIRSPIHRKNLEGDFNTTGMGAARGEDGRLYFTQLFLKR